MSKVFDLEGLEPFNRPAFTLEELQKVQREHYWAHLLSALRSAGLLHRRGPVKVINKAGRAYLASPLKDEPLDDMFVADGIEELKVRLESLLALEDDT